VVPVSDDVDEATEVIVIAVKSIILEVGCREAMALEAPLADEGAKADADATVQSAPTIA